MLLSLLAWPLSALLRLRYGPQAALAPPLVKVRKHMRVAGLLTVLPWVMYAGIGLVVANDNLFVTAPLFPILLRLVQALAWLAVAGTIGTIWAAFASRRWRSSSIAMRAHHVLFLLACSGAATIAWQGGLLIWNGKF